jgi:hypothetical protein
MYLGSTCLHGASEARHWHRLVWITHQTALLLHISLRVIPLLIEQLPQVSWKLSL